jgi:PAS domain S-box-containing protein
MATRANAQPAPRLSPRRIAALERRAAWQRLPDVAQVLALVFGLFAAAPLLTGFWWRSPAVAAGTAVAAGAMLALHVAVRRGRVPHRWAHTVLGLAMALIVARSLLGWAVIQGGDQLGVLAVVLFGVAYACVSSAWAYGLIAAILVGCLAPLWLVALDPAGESRPIFVVVAAPVAILLHRTRRLDLRREALRRVHERRYQAELRAAMARASENERRFRGIFERIQDVYLRVHISGRIEMISPSVTRFGYQPHELIGGDARQLFTAADVARGQRLIDSHGPVGDVEMRLRCRDGSETVVSVSGSIVRDVHGVAVGYEGIVRDISQRKRLEAERREQQAELAHVLRLSSMGEMAAEMAHELTQPLAAMVNYASACMRYVRRGRDEHAKLLQGLELIAQQGLRAGEIVRRIRSYVAKRPPQREVADVVALVTQAAHTVSGDGHRCRLPIVVEPAPGTWLASVDAIQIEQVIVNLLLNAVEAVALPAEGDRIVVSVGGDGDGRIEVAVSDTGCGLGSLASRVFDPFFSTKPSGLGMGLAISRSIIETHGGRLWATPNADRGTTFRFTVPRLAAADARDAAATMH